MTENYFGVKIHIFDDFLETRRKIFAYFLASKFIFVFLKILFHTIEFV